MKGPLDNCYCLIHPPPNSLFPRLILFLHCVMRVKNWCRTTGETHNETKINTIWNPWAEIQQQSRTSDGEDGSRGNRVTAPQKLNKELYDPAIWVYMQILKSIYANTRRQWVTAQHLGLYQPPERPTLNPLHLALARSSPAYYNSTPSPGRNWWNNHLNLGLFNSKA